VFVGDTGLGGGVLVGGFGGISVGCGVLVGGGLLAVGGNVAVGSWGGLVATGATSVGVGVRTTAGGTVLVALLVGVLTLGVALPGVDVAGRLPAENSVGVGVGEDGVTCAILSRLPVSGGRLTPSRSWIISNPIAGTDTGISSTP
jgi:hypothetical protein